MGHMVQVCDKTERERERGERDGDKRLTPSLPFTLSTASSSPASERRAVGGVKERTREWGGDNAIYLSHTYALSLLFPTKSLAVF